MIQKNSRKEQEYYLGLDMGTESVGWAVTDLDYHLLRYRGKQMWGTRLFESAKTAEERRTFRAGRRRLGRRKQRIKLLEELFSEEITKIDPGFFLRLKESKFLLEDKKVQEKYVLFCDEKYTDKEYFKQFPTIYHLRKDLIEGKGTYDIRLYYLAIHHILKHRGHFLFEGQNMRSITSFENVYGEICENLSDEYGVDLFCDSEQELADILKNREMKVTAKTSALTKQFHVDNKEKGKKAIIKLLAGGTVALKDLFAEEGLADAEISKISFASASYDDDILALEDTIPEHIYIIQKIKMLYDWGVLANIIGKEKYLSFAKVDTYEKHKKDLTMLKKVIREYPCFSDEDYKAIFSDLDISHANYAIYVGKTSNSGKKKPTEKRKDINLSQEALCKFIVGYLNRIPQEERNEDVEYLLSEGEAGMLLPKQVAKSNGVIPYQLHLEELRAILVNLQKDYPSFATKDEEGWSSCEKIEKLLTFRIPYYVGPLNDAHADKDYKKGNCWIVKKKDIPVLPWNFDEVVDKDESAKRFIRRMTNKCTYLIGEDVVAKDSILYSKYMVLNEINNLRIDQEKIDVALKQKIYKDIFENRKIKGKITPKKIGEYLVREGIFEKGEQHEITGIDVECKSSLASYCDMKEIFGTKVNTDMPMIEDIIVSIVLFNDDKKILKNRLTKQYVETGRATDEEIARVIKKRYTGWGRLSAKFLQEIEGTNRETGETGTILHFLWETNDNLMQILSGKYTFLKEIEKMNQGMYDESGRISYEMVDELYVSPAVKRMIWQSLSIVKDVQRIMGHEPKKIFVEMAREKTNEGRTQSRKNKLLELYKNCKDEETDWIKEIGDADESDFRSIKRYLYYTQMGKCMYCGKRIDLHELMTTDTYDRDHIYPQSKTKDDSLDNLVLVCKEHNAEKSDEYPIDHNIQQKMAPFWNSLKEREFISKKKWGRLIRKDPLSADELASFVARQLVETRQSTKAVADILNRIFQETEIVYVKAGLVSDFRRDNDYIKVREINDYHHAQDAYLNVVVGNVYNTKFTRDPINFIKEAKPRDWSLNRMFNFDVERNGIIAWKRGKQGTIATVDEVMFQDLSKLGRIQFTRYATETKGGLYDQMLMKKGKGQVPIKGSDKRLTVEKYGGYNKAAGAYFMWVESDGKKGRIRTMEFVPIYLVRELEKSEERKIQYCEEELGLKNPRILLDKVKFNSLLFVDGYPVHISGRTGKQLIMKNGVQLYVINELNAYLIKVIKYVNRNSQRTDKKSNLPLTQYDGITASKNLEVYCYLLEKHRTNILKKRPASQVRVLQEGMDRFENLTPEEQCLVLYEILHLFQCRKVSADLKRLGGSGNAGILLMPKELSKFNSVKLIHQSPTGLTEQVIDLLAL